MSNREATLQATHAVSTLSYCWSSIRIVLLTHAPLSPSSHLNQTQTERRSKFYAALAARLDAVFADFVADLAATSAA
jgi:hypothetical protein